MIGTLRVLASCVAAPLGAAAAWSMVRQCRKPAGWPGRLIVAIMNRSHAGLINWGLSHVHVDRHATILDVGCGGGRTIRTLGKMADLGMVQGVDYSNASVTASRSFNKAAIEAGKVSIQSATVSSLPFPEHSFDLVTAVETHYYWPNLPNDVREIRRVLKPGGSLLIIAESYRTRGGLDQLAMKPLGGNLLTPDEHREMFVQAGYSDVEVFLERARGWICVKGTKPIS